MTQAIYDEANRLISGKDNVTMHPETPTLAYAAKSAGPAIVLDSTRLSDIDRMIRGLTFQRNDTGIRADRIEALFMDASNKLVNVTFIWDETKQEYFFTLG